ncbi:hypothetical protein J5J83_05920 [Azoarcus sp. L1K30]|uniref:hypothetical protein n=1 Tax=Azoarcus sp. L1K30 TaxID=2820277 RepID=UPI001B828E6C|nr:hypothetical protein [Azoarcus sp. L1K30]MBR0565654.1 hypothetical protein [Azoarcus sp. L1K30]
MGPVSRIPALREASFDGALAWFSDLYTGALLFHPDDDPAEVYRVRDWHPLFSEVEAEEVRSILGKLFSLLGDRVYEAAYPIYMKACGNELDG